MLTRSLIQKCWNKSFHNYVKNPMILYQRNISTTVFRFNREQLLSRQELDEKERIKQMSEYFNQYVDEYYEEEEIPDDENIAEDALEVKELKDNVIKESIYEITVEEVVELLQEHRAQDIVSIDVDPTKGPHPHVVICTPYNARHSGALVQTIRKHIKEKYHFDDSQMPQQSKISNGWYIFDMRNVILHIMSEEARERYKIEEMFAEEENEDDNEEIDDSIPSPSGKEIQ